MTKKILAILLALVMVIALCACAQTDAGKTDGGKTDGGKTDGGKTDDKTDGKTDDKGGDAEYSVTFALNDGLTTTDDFNNFSMANKHLCHLWGDTLVELNYETNEYYNALATDIKWADDNLSCDVTIREGVKFSNGDEVKGEDVAFSFQRIVDAEKYGLTNVMVWYKLAGAEATGDYTATIKFTEPMPNFNSEACWLPIICKAAFEADPENFWNAPVGSGIYKWVETDFVDGTAKLERWNDDWYGYELFGTTPGNVKYVCYNTIAENTTRVSALRSGEVQICGNVPAENIAAVEGDGFIVKITPKTETCFLSLNCKSNEWFADKNFREAMSLAIDRELLVESIQGGNGTVATFCVPPSVEGYVSGYSYEYNPEKAKELLAQTSYKGETIQLDISTSLTNSAELAQALAGMFAEVGINLNITQMEGAAWNSARFAGEYTMQLCSFSMTANSNFKIIYEIIGPLDKFMTQLPNEAAMEKFNAALVEMDHEKYCQYSGEGMSLIFENFGPMLYLFDNVSSVGVDPDLKNLSITNDSTMELRYLAY